MLRRTPIRLKGKRKSAAMKRHHDRVAGLGCAVCLSPAEVHHVTGFADRMGRFTRDDSLVTPLCPLHHRGVGERAPFLVSVESLGHRGFYAEHGIDLYSLACSLWAASEDAERRAA